MLFIIVAKHTIKTPERSCSFLSLLLLPLPLPLPNNEAIKMQQISSSFRPRASTALEWQRGEEEEVERKFLLYVYVDYTHVCVIEVFFSLNLLRLRKIYR
jgi:hypothetical protein